jgi:hypothetical protein
MMAKEQRKEGEKKSLEGRRSWGKRIDGLKRTRIEPCLEKKKEKQIIKGKRGTLCTIIQTRKKNCTLYHSNSRGERRGKKRQRRRRNLKVVRIWISLNQLQFWPGLGFRLEFGFRSFRTGLFEWRDDALDTTALRPSTIPCPRRTHLRYTP